MHYHIDAPHRDFVEGWAVAEVYVDNRLVGITQANLPRPDVAATLPESSAKVDMCGFLFPFSSRHFRGRALAQVNLRIVPRQEHPVASRPEPVANRSGDDLAQPSQQEEPRHPARFPMEIMGALRALRGPAHFDVPWTDAIIEEALGDIEFLVLRGTKLLPGFYSYLGYLKSLWAKFELVRDHFPKRFFPSRSRKILPRRCVFGWM
jgi:hypothetical protein